MHAECYQNRWVCFLHVLDLWSYILYIIKNDLSLNSGVWVSNSPVYWCFSYKYPEINSVKCSLRASLLRNSHLFSQSWVFPFLSLKVVLCVKKCDLSRYTWLLLDRLLRLSHFCTRNAASLTVLDQALYCDSIPRSATRLYPPCSRQLSCLHGQRHYFVIHLPRIWCMMCVPSLPGSGKFIACGIQNPGIQNTALGIRNPTNDWHPEFKFHWQYLESGIHCVELTWQVLAVPICVLGFYLLLAWGALQTFTVSFCSFFFFSFYTFLFYPRHHELHPRSTTLACLRHLAILR